MSPNSTTQLREREREKKLKMMNLLLLLLLLLSVSKKRFVGVDTAQTPQTRCCRRRTNSFVGGAFVSKESFFEFFFEFFVRYF